MKTGLPNLTFLCNFLQLLMSNISLFTVLFTADFVYLFIFIFLNFLLLSGLEVEIITTPPHPATPPRPAPMCLPLTTILSLIQVTVIRNQCAPKAGFHTA